MAVITYTDLQRYMNRTFDAGQQQAANIVISSLQNQLSTWLNIPVTPVSIIDEVHRLKVNQRQIFLYKSPVIEVTSFYVGMSGQEVEQNIDDFDIYPWGIDNIRIAGEGYRALVTYTAGPDPVDMENLSYIVLSAAGREMNKVLLDAQGLMRMTVENSQYYMSRSGAGGYTEEELKMASRYKRRVIV
jgi:hypothetical protein